MQLQNLRERVGYNEGARRQFVSNCTLGRKRTFISAASHYVDFMISDTEELTGVDLVQLFNEIDTTLVHTGVIWQYNKRLAHLSSSAHKFDKFTIEKLGVYCSTLGAGQSVIARKSVRQIVEPHLVHRFVLRMDVKRYYESIHFNAIKIHLERAQFTEDFIDHIRIFYFDTSGYLRRGLRGSALLSELIGVKIDNEVARCFYESRIVGVTYSRYYDDLLYSADSRDDLRIVEAGVVELLSAMGLSTNESKSKLTQIENSKILGLRIHKGKIIVPKEFKRILRVREYRLSQCEQETDFSDMYSIHELKRYTGHVIGSLWYIVKNSDEDTLNYEHRIEEYKHILSTCDDALSEISRENEDDRDLFH